MSTLSLSPNAAPGRWRRFLGHPLVRIVLASVMVILPVPVIMALVHQLDRPLRQVWPQLLAAALCVAVYRLFVRRIERRDATELSRAGAAGELGLGAAIGAALFLLVIGALAVCGAFRLAGSNSWTALLAPLAEMVLVALIEELVFRAILFRIAERSLGSMIALPLSSVLFAAAHLPNEGVTLLAVTTTALAGLMLAAAYMVTRRLWLPAGLHFAWNYLSDGVFSLPTSGHPGRGWLQGELSGPDWLSGGAYGVESSLVTLLVLAVASALLLRAAWRRGQRMAPSWRTSGNGRGA